MGWSFRRSKKFGPFRLNFSKRGLGVSVGGPGARISLGADGRVRESYGLPGTGIRYQQTIGQGRSRRTIAPSIPYHPDRPPSAKPVPLSLGCLGSVVLLGIVPVVGLRGVASLIGVVVALVFPLALHWWSKSRARRHDEAAFSVYLQDLIDRFGEPVAERMVAGDPWQGATQEMTAIMFGPPVDTTTKVHKQLTAEVWKYGQTGKNRYALRVEFENGVCVGWHKA